MAIALLVVPPFLKYIAGPLLGPAMLAGAGEAAGHQVRVLDLNARFLRQHLLELDGDPRFVGDHDRSEALRRVQREFREITAPFLPQRTDSLPDDPVQTLPYGHAEVLHAAQAIASSQWGAWMESALESEDNPDVVGVSVLYSGQVVWGLALSIVARRRWPGCLIVWGGPHVTALRDRIEADARYSAVVDQFVYGYAERTFVDLLDAVNRGGSLPPEVLAAGSGSLIARDLASVKPRFNDLHLYGPRLTLPAQASRGCAYGRCRFCTYPVVEGRFRTLPEAGWMEVIAEAERLGAAVCFKDSLVLPHQLGELTDRIAGRVRWSACTKLHPRLDDAFLAQLAVGGCATLEFGLETLTPAGQVLFEKKQTPELFRAVIAATAKAGISVIVNYITGIPGVDVAEDAHWLRFVRVALEEHPTLVAKVEHNTFQLERLSPMGRAPASLGLRVTGEWPWSSVLGWELAEELAAMAC